MHLRRGPKSPNRFQLTDFEGEPHHYAALVSVAMIPDAREAEESDFDSGVVSEDLTWNVLVNELIEWAEKQPPGTRFKCVAHLPEVTR